MGTDSALPNSALPNSADLEALEVSTWGPYQRIQPHAASLDFRNSDGLRQKFDAILQQINQRPDIMLDLAMVNFMDSAGLSFLLSVKKLCEKAGGSFCLCNVHGYVQNLVQLTNLNRVVTIYHTAEQALPHSEGDSPDGDA
ncbi:MAG: STAS domain-containing protein [Candidatus Melainabacteria bacterium]|nr:STAS domain-containing protein [Candidatus Melainabacteria bacterium]